MPHNFRYGHAGRGKEGVSEWTPEWVRPTNAPNEEGHIWSYEVRREEEHQKPTSYMAGVRRGVSTSLPYVGIRGGRRAITSITVIIMAESRKELSESLPYRLATRTSSKNAIHGVYG